MLPMASVPASLTSGGRISSFLSSDVAGMGPDRPIHRSFEHRVLNVIVVIKHVHSMTRVHVIVVIQQLQTKHRLSRQSKRKVSAPPRFRGACAKGSQEFETLHGNRYYSLKLLLKLLCDQFTDSVSDSQ